MALSTGIPENKLRVIAPDVGGGFGAKLQFYREEILATVIANRLGRPVKWSESRSENMVATHHGRDQIQFIEMAATREGKILGMKVELLANMGAYLQLLTPGIPVLGQFMFNGIYKMDAYDWKSTGVFTTTTPTDAYRGAGRPEATFAVERMLDELAVELDIEPMELRQRNWITARGIPVHHGRRADLRQRQLRGRDRQGDGAVRLRRRCAPNRRPVARPAIRSNWASASPRSPRCVASRRPAPCRR